MRKFIVLAVLAAVAGCSGGRGNNQSAADGGDHPEWLVGRWASERNPGNCDSRIPEVELFADGDSEFEGRSGNWRVEGDRLVVSRTDDDAEVIVKVRFRRDGDRVRLLGGPRQIFVRCGTRAARDAAREQRDAAANAMIPMYNEMNSTDYMSDNSAMPMDNGASNAM